MKIDNIVFEHIHSLAEEIYGSEVYEPFAVYATTNAISNIIDANIFNENPPYFLEEIDDISKDMLISLRPEEIDDFDDKYEEVGQNLESSLDERDIVEININEGDDVQEILNQNFNKDEIKNKIFVLKKIEENIS